MHTNESGKFLRNKTLNILGTYGFAKDVFVVAFLLGFRFAF